MLRLAILLACIWGSAGFAGCNPDLELIQLSSSANHTVLAPRQITTPAPTYPPGVACDCLPPACFAAYDSNNDSVISFDECDVQTPLEGCWSKTVPHNPNWDLDNDGVINYTEFLKLNLSEVCPLEPMPSPCSCCAGEYIDGITANGDCKCSSCDGSTRRRRSISCDTCPPGKIFVPEDDDCVCSAEVFLEKPHSNGSCSLDIQLNNPPNYVVGDNISILTRTSGRVLRYGTDSGCEGSWSTFRNATIETTIITVIQGDNITISPCLANSFVKYDPVILTCTTMDGTLGSRKHTSVCNREEMCQCGFAQCSSYELCDCTAGYPNACTCEPAGPWPDHPTPAPTVGAKGDPHLVNIQGEHFDINHGGEFVLLRIPMDAERPVELGLKALIRPEFEHPCTTYITQVEVYGSWIGNTTVQARSYLKDHPGRVVGAFLGARALAAGADPYDAEWDSIETFLADAPELVLSAPDSPIEVKMTKSQWFPKKEIAKGVPTVAGMFTLTLRNPKSTSAAKIVVRQDLPEQEHLNLAVQKLSALGRADVGGLLGFDEHPLRLEQVSSHCVHYRAEDKMRVESVENNENYYRPPWKERWDKIRKDKKESRNKDGDKVIEVGAEANLFGYHREKQENMMCKCPHDIARFDEGVLVDARSAHLHAEASWD